MKTTEAARPNLSSLKRNLPRPWPLVIVLVIVSAAAVYAGIRYFSGEFVQREKAAGADAAAASPAESGEAPPITLTTEKIAAAGIHVSPIALRELRETRTFPGKIDHDETRRLEVRLPVGGVLKKVHVGLGQDVKSGDPLAILSSQEIGLARDELFRRRADLAIALAEQEWLEDVSRNLTELLTYLEKHPQPEEVEAQFRQKRLGEHRDKLLSAYSKLHLAEQAIAAVEPLKEDNLLSGRMIQERRSARQVAAAQFHGAREQSQFDGDLMLRKARATVEQARRMEAVSRQRLESLSGPLAKSETEETRALSDLVLLAPFDGVIEERPVVEGGQIAAGQALFALADVSSLWVSAEVYEHDWKALKVEDKQTVWVRIPALQDREFVAPVIFVGAAVSEKTKGVSLVARLDNSERQLKPGMFAWITAAVGPPRTVTAVPTGAIMRHEGETFAFVEQTAGTYRRVDLKTGLRTPEWVEVLSGLKPGDRVVDHGAFFLKSELLLEKEPE